MKQHYTLMQAGLFKAIYQSICFYLLLIISASVVEAKDYVSGNSDVGNYLSDDCDDPEP